MRVVNEFCRGEARVKEWKEGLKWIGEVQGTTAGSRSEPDALEPVNSIGQTSAPARPQLCPKSLSSTPTSLCQHRHLNKIPLLPPNRPRSGGFIILNNE